MTSRLSIFQWLLFVLMLMLLIIVMAFWIIYMLNVKDIQSELRRNKMNEVKFITSQLSTQFEQVLTNTITLSQDQSVRGYPYILKFGDQYSKYEMKLTIIDKLALNTASTSWNNTVILYYPDEKETVSSDPSYSFSSFAPPAQTYNRWILNMAEDGTGYYSTVMRSHLSPLLIEVRISLDNLRKMMEQYVSGTPILYDSQKKVFVQKGEEFSEKLYPTVIPRISGDSGTFSVKENGTEYLINYMKSDMLDLYFIDAYPKRQYIEPINRNNRLFLYVVLIVLFGVLLYTLLLRRQVQKPVITLKKAIDRFDRGDYSSRAVDLQVNEFRMLGNSFNRMAENTQRLIEQVLLGDIEVKEAKLKQYQAQINPHFLYNCLNYIQSKASIEDYQAVTAMTLHLASYCRYIHKIEQIDSTLQDELDFVEHYLFMVHLRKREIAFDIDIPEHLGKYRLPRMILQPLVENGILHGIEPSLMPGVITITAEEDKTYLLITVKDNGVGMEADRLSAVRRHMDDYIIKNQTLGTGLRNVNQRLRLYFGKRSGLLLESSPSEGTCYRIQIEKVEENHATHSAG
ncbi:sensor histidine kinase [Paenibacillus wynnii]|uniref:sensor histidine kinase n=1 Tax=Paenibacillus wynnii TaxID=268407 RepID=UPI00278E82AB|nr:sensor histidine kinase [Paenibacillus wynnii]MDQ0192506.1 two-component system sensor histidine kinase YesM [Paenibacillus wynnii]